MLVTTNLLFLLNHQTSSLDILTYLHYFIDHIHQIVPTTFIFPKYHYILYLINSKLYHLLVIHLQKILQYLFFLIKVYQFLQFVHFNDPIYFAQRMHHFQHQHFLYIILIFLILLITKQLLQYLPTILLVFHQTEVIFQ